MNVEYLSMFGSSDKSNPFIVNKWLEEYFIVQKKGDIE